MIWLFPLLFIYLTPFSASVAIYEQCGGEGYTGPTQCNWPLGCFRRSRWFSSCQLACPGDDWECASLIATTKSTSLAQAGNQCGGEGWNGPQGCLEYSCQWRSKWYAECRPDCPADWLCQSSGSGSTVEPIPTTVDTTESINSGSIVVTTPSLNDNNTEDIFGRYIVTQILGSDAFDLDMDSFQLPENSGLFDIIVQHIVNIAETEEPGLMARYSVTLQSDNLDERLAALVDMRERIERIVEGSELAAILMQEPLFLELQATNLLENLGANVRALRIDTNPCNGLIPDIGKENGLYGSEPTSTSFLQGVKDGAKAALKTVLVNGVILVETEFDQGEAPDPESRLGAYYATRGYESGTVGSAVHRAIGAIYMTLGTIGEEKIGRVFNSEAAKALYNQPVESVASVCIAQIEHLYWENVKKENPDSIGGKLGSAVSPGHRDCIQRLLSGSLCSSAKPRSLPKTGGVLIIPSGYLKTNYRCMNKPVYCNPKASSALACIVEDRTSHKGGVWKAGSEKTWAQIGCPVNLRSGTYDANLNWIAS